MQPARSGASLASSDRIEIDMTPLEKVYQTIPSYQSAGRLTLDVISVLRPVSERAEGELVILGAFTDFATRAGIDWLVDEPGVAAVSRAALRDHVVAVRTRGTVLSTDRIALAQLDARGVGWSVDLDLMRFESFDGEPAPRELWVLLSIEPGDQPLESLTLRFSGRLRDSRGNETLLREPTPAPYTIPFTA